MSAFEALNRNLWGTPTEFISDDIMEVLDKQLGIDEKDLIASMVVGTVSMGLLYRHYRKHGWRSMMSLYGVLAFQGLASTALFTRRQTRLINQTAESIAAEYDLPTSHENGRTVVLSLARSLGEFG